MADKPAIQRKELPQADFESKRALNRTLDGIQKRGRVDWVGEVFTVALTTSTVVTPLAGQITPDCQVTLQSCDEFAASMILTAPGVWIDPAAYVPHTAVVQGRFTITHPSIGRIAHFRYCIKG